MFLEVFFQKFLDISVLLFFLMLSVPRAKKGWEPLVWNDKISLLFLSCEERFKGVLCFAWRHRYLITKFALKVKSLIMWIGVNGFPKSVRRLKGELAKLSFVGRDKNEKKLVFHIFHRLKATRYLFSKVCEKITAV